MQLKSIQFELKEGASKVIALANFLNEVYSKH